MEAPSPARLYAAAFGAALVLLGILGFFYTASFNGLEDYEDAIAGLQVNGWLNLLYVAAGAVGLLVAGASSRTYALVTGLLFIALAIIGWGSGWLNLVVGVLGLAAALGTTKSEPRAKPARQGS
ncbi:MAG TPA: DUF4383 domain-containing protein [Solirubrobacterales bacterium]|nr:DUF4383 domain-containing protein [Solirubrobacterales bacterium]